jgi:Na+/proline symporter
MSTFLLCFAAWSAIALGMDRHHEDTLGREGTERRLLHLRRAGWLVLLLSLWLAVRPSGEMPASLGVTAWTVALSVAALAVTAVVTWQPRRAPVAAGVALAAGLLAWAGGW